LEGVILNGRPPFRPRFRARGSEASAGAFHDQFALELGKACEDCKYQPAIGGGGVDRRTFACQHLEADATFRQITDCVNQVTQVAPKPVQLPDDQRVSPSERLRAGIKAGALIEPARSGIFIKVAWVDARCGQRIASQVMGLRAVSLRDAGISDQHVTYTSVCVTEPHCPSIDLSNVT
jgi:hypothetical protein